jgi:hypothetical protein
MVGILKNAKPLRTTIPAPGNPQDSPRSSGAKAKSNGQNPQRITVTFPRSMAPSTSEEILGAKSNNAPIVVLAVKTAPAIVSELTISVP